MRSWREMVLAWRWSLPRVFRILLAIGNQASPNIFDLTCAKPSLLYEESWRWRNASCWTSFILPTSIRKKIGVTGEAVRIVQTPNLDQVQKGLLEPLREKGITALAIATMHSYVYPEHELELGKLAESMGFTQVSLSSQVMPMVKIVSRYETNDAVCLNVCTDCTCNSRTTHPLLFLVATQHVLLPTLTPKITAYLDSFRKGFDQDLSKVPLTFMKSDGGLAPVSDFGGHQAILSGPAGGVVGYAKTTPRLPVIGFDMGGTSTDVSRYDGHWEHVFETVTAGVAIQAYVLS